MRSVGRQQFRQVRLGRCRTLIRRMLQRRLITGRAEAPIHLTRHFEWSDGSNGADKLRIHDVVTLTHRRAKVRRMSYGTDHQTAYVAACGVYQDGVLEPWTDLQDQVEELNATGRVTIVRDVA